MQDNFILFDSLSGSVVRYSFIHFKYFVNLSNHTKLLIRIKRILICYLIKDIKPFKINSFDKLKTEAHVSEFIFRNKVQLWLEPDIYFFD